MRLILVNALLSDQIRKSPSLSAAILQAAPGKSCRLPDVLRKWSCRKCGSSNPMANSKTVLSMVLKLDVYGTAAINKMCLPVQI